MPFYGGDASALLKSRNSPFALPLAKRIILHLLRGIAFAHERRIVHTDIKLDNILFTTSATNEDIEKWMQNDPPRRNPPEMSPDGVLQSAVSQPMTAPSEQEALQATYVLSDFAQPSKLHNDHQITSLLLRPPEALLGGEWDTPADIWTFGCLVYEIVTVEPFFRYKRNQVYDFSEMANLLYQMMLKTGEVFRAKQLSVWPLAIEYFQPENCCLKKEPKIFYFSAESNIGQHNLRNESRPKIFFRISGFKEWSELHPAAKGALFQVYSNVHDGGITGLTVGVRRCDAIEENGFLWALVGVKHTVRIQIACAKWSRLISQSLRALVFRSMSTTAPAVELDELTVTTGQHFSLGANGRDDL
ncbi:hypothetical protein CCMSSC00406_0010237 [Pleurotus cornucopiae]|uniref:Uncharacterized protein n=1 Tax=Pleurotus cornucopiae TaxID=5321 RepID=A0ACB7JB69_PLECO|nr:hypothetical protein CCMSSC00406_0010237 [Pleurotus cornucopiae]